MEKVEGKKSGVISLCIGAIGVVYGDVGTSPLYTMKEVFSGPYGIPATAENILGVLSLVFWALMVVISLKYITFVMRADNRGEGGIMALVALALRRRHQRRERYWIILIGLFGTALFYGDGIITPAISVLSAVEGLQVAAPSLERFVIPIAVLVLLGLFFIQSKGTAKVGASFGPVMVVWFVVLAWLGFDSLRQDTSVLAALDPRYGVHFFMEHRWHGFLALGAVVLALTGAEALYADMGHFGKRPIQATWFTLILPALVLNYFGQGALILRAPEAIQNPFYLLAPSWALYPLIVLATLATVIASQAVISGAFSITRQAIQLDYLPRQRLVHTSTAEIGQIYVPAVNWILMIGVTGLVLGFQSSSNLASAYGIAVTGTMIITTLLVWMVALDSWKWRPAYAGALMGTFAVVDLSFFSANIPKIPHGGWFPLAFGVCIFVLMSAWKRGRETLMQHLQREAISLRTFLADIEKTLPVRVPGTAVFMTSRHLSLPFPLLQNFENNKVLHEQVILLTVNVEDVPYLAEYSRLEVENLGQGFYRITVNYGFMESADIPAVLQLAKQAGLDIKPSETVYFIGRESLMLSERAEMNPWLARLFISLFRNAASPTAFFKIPTQRVMELGVWVEI
ncbi:MAG TPA: potassium transporter Kup [Methylococcaceae bacterium]|jgi:KUP system potassium uptake protein|nr:potassium transporter Kup [Methylococcaceae bacterium]